MPAKTARPSQVGNIQSLTDLFAVALSQERNAAERCRQIILNLDHYGNREVADLFRALLPEVRRSEESIREVAADAGLQVEDLGPAIQTGEVPSLELLDNDASGFSTLTPFEALDEVRRFKQRALELYAQIAAEAESDSLRRSAEALANLQLTDLARIRAARIDMLRKHSAESGQNWLKDREVSLAALEELQERTEEILQRLVAVCRAAAQRLAAAGRPDLASTIDDALAGTGPGDAGTAAELSNAPSAGPRGALQEAIRTGEAGFEHLLAIGEAALTEEVLRRAQSDASRVLAVLTVLNEALRQVSQDE